MILTSRNLIEVFKKVYTDFSEEATLIADLLDAITLILKTSKIKSTDIFE